MKQHSTRREFLQLAALAGAMVTPAQALARDADKSRPHVIVYRTLERTGLRLAIVRTGSCYAVNLIQVARNEGIVYFQSSGGYADGQHERLMGKALKPFPPPGGFSPTPSTRSRNCSPTS